MSDGTEVHTGDDESPDEVSERKVEPGEKPAGYEHDGDEYGSLRSDEEGDEDAAEADSDG